MLSGRPDTTTRRAPRRRARSTRARLVVVAAVLCGILAGPLATAPPAGAYPGAPWFEPGRPYRANFPDPSVLVHDGVAYAYGTATGGAYLPVMSSRDLATWTARPRHQPNPYNGDPYYNDALVQPPSWGVDRPGAGHMPKEIIAPGVARIGGQFVAFLTVRTRMSPARWCISVATSSSPLGPFRDATPGPLVCDPDPAGSIDPQPFVDADGTPYLLWKSEGVPGSTPTRIWSRQLAPNGTSFAAGSSARVLLQTSQAWEGNVIENPSMVRHGGRYHLVYSGNEWRSPHYGTGYASCSGPLGPCTKHGGNPILSRRGGAQGMGGGSAFVDQRGRLMLAFHWWNAPHSDYPSCPAGRECTDAGQRRMAVAPLTVDGSGPRVGEQLGRFFDVPEGSYFDDPAWWLKRTAISGGVGAPGNFGPHETVTRAQMSAFLWRMMDSPRPNPAHGFRDVPAASYFEQPVRWLLRRGITTGISGSSTTFAPHEPVTRAQMAAFLWRTAGSPQVGTRHTFADVPRSAYFSDAVSWLRHHGITTGVSGSTTRFAPHEPVSRAQMAAFLHRMVRTPGAWTGGVPRPATANAA